MKATHDDIEFITAFIGVGANLGFARDAVLNAMADLGRLPKTEFAEASSLYASEPIDGEGPDFINAVAQIETQLSAADLLTALQAIETRYGRVRTTKNAPRTLDLDLLLYGDGLINAPDLVVPHPRMHERAFVLLPLIEVAGAIKIPGKGPADKLVAGLKSQRVDRVEP